MRSSYFRRGQRRVALPLFVLMTALACGSDPTGPRWYYFPGKYQLLSVDGRTVPDTLTLPGSPNPTPPALYTVVEGMVQLTTASTSILIALNRVSDFDLSDRSGSFVGTQIGDSLFVLNQRRAYQRGDTMVVETGGTPWEVFLGAHEWRFLKTSSL